MRLTHENAAAVLATLRDEVVKHITLHWTAGYRCSTFPDYHFSIDGQGRVFYAGPPYRTLPHTYKRNAGNCAVALNAMVGASPPSTHSARDAWRRSFSAYTAKLETQTAPPAWPKSYGNQAPTIHQLRSLVWLVPLLMRTWGLGFNAVRTHENWATLDGYGPGSGDPETRWDLWLEGQALVDAAEREYRRTKPAAAPKPKKKGGK